MFAVWLPDVEVLEVDRQGKGVVRGMHEVERRRGWFGF